MRAYASRIACSLLSGLKKAYVCMISGLRKITPATYVLRIAYSAHVISHSWWIMLATHAYALRIAYLLLSGPKRADACFPSGLWCIMVATHSCESRITLLLLSGLKRADAYA